MKCIDSLHPYGKLWLILLLLPELVCLSQTTGSKPVETVPYSWKNVQYVGGGFVDGIVFHPAEKGLCYCRTDMGGAYRRNPETLRWEPLLDWISYKDRNLMGVESIALDYSDPDKLYLACGTYTNPGTPDGAILRSSDRGNTFERTDVPFKMGGNEDGRGNGERMAVDPLNGRILFLGTRNAGLWKSIDGAISWQAVKSFPDPVQKAPSKMHDADSISRWLRMNRGSGIIFVIFNPQGQKSRENCQTVFAGISRINENNIYRSLDGGQNWEPLEGQPLSYRPTHAVLASNGMLYITYGNMPGPSGMTDGAVWKFDTRSGKWTNITPDKPVPSIREFGYAAVSVERDNPNALIVSSYNRYKVDNGEDIFRSLDGGLTWKQVFKSGGVIDSRLAPYTAHTGIHWLFDIEIDPHNPDHAIFTTGYGGHETFNLSDMEKGKPTIWSIMSTGIEETVPLELLSPPIGASLITAIGDYGGAVHWNLDQPAPEGNFTNPRFGNTNGIACAEKNPDHIVRVGRATGDNPGQTIGFSVDGGRTWSPADTLPHPGAALGHIAVSAEGNTWVWTPEPIRTFGQGRQIKVIPVFRTTDKGKSWSECKDIPGNTRVIADRVNDQKFYAVDLFNGILYTSNDAGISFTPKVLELPDSLPKKNQYRGDTRGGQDRIYATPGIEGELWIAAYDGLYLSENSGNTFKKLDDVQEMHGFGFGMSAPDMDYPVLYMIGTIYGVRGIFRSDDKGSTWKRINDDQHQWGLLMHITGDPKKFGRVYVGTHGRGTLYGDAR